MHPLLGLWSGLDSLHVGARVGYHVRPVCLGCGVGLALFRCGGGCWIVCPPILVVFVWF